jgi:hypothetical protein
MITSLDCVNRRSEDGVDTAKTSDPIWYRTKWGDPWLDDRPWNLWIVWMDSDQSDLSERSHPISTGCGWRTWSNLKISTSDLKTARRKEQSADQQHTLAVSNPVIWYHMIRITPVILEFCPDLSQRVNLDRNLLIMRWMSPEEEEQIQQATWR